MPDQNKTESYIKTYSESDSVIDGRVIRTGEPIFELLDPVADSGQTLPLSEEEARKIIAETAEKVARELFPQIADRVIREEIEKLKKS